MVKLIELAQDSLHQIETRETPDFELLEDVMKYATGYSDVHHHPTEDVMFERLRERAPGIGDRIDALLSEHSEIVAKGEELLKIIRSIEEDAMVERAHVLRVGHEYLTKLQNHMNIEETELFPAAKSFLEATDWEVIEEKVGKQDDPLFGPSLDREFERLWTRIQAHGRQ